ncbi:hypothetical protein [Mycolicibacterium mengxianglii]|uniref:hypothetical protein n=1 Tax=Mycolicibacterium mengxianglii TaxID=2736649 RepID=UPI0018EF206C|nr:hypothetical protein [Mycolicibacterium mengxianglii]
MQILASALPGFRDLRAPLAAGYLWLLFLVMLKPEITDRPTNAVAVAIYDLGKSAGPIWVSVGISFGAYLIGSISQTFSTALERMIDRMVELRKHLRLVRNSDSVRSELEPEMEIPSNIENSQITKLYRRAVAENRNMVFLKNKKERDRFFRNLRMRATEAQRGLDIELAMPATLLIGKDQAAFSEADRLKAESQLRYGILLPLTAVLIFLIANHSPLWSVGGVALVILGWQAYAKNREFKTLMLGAVQRQVIQSQSIEEFEVWVSNLALEYQPIGEITLNRPMS